MNWFSVPVLTVLLLGTASAYGADRTHAKCAADFDQCQADCNTKYADDVGGRAACIPKCSGMYAACDAGVAYDKAKPWLEEQADKTKKAIDDLIDKLKNDPPAETPPATGKSI